MPASSSSDPSESITLRLGQLSLTVSVNPAPENRDRTAPAPEGAESDREWSIVSGEESSAWTSELLPRLFPVSLETRALAANSASEFAALDLDCLHLGANRLGGSDRNWIPAARLGRAFRAGLIARRHLSGEFSARDSSLATPFKNQFYVVLQGLDGQGCWTKDFHVYSEKVFIRRRGVRTFGEGTVSHAFASLIECRAYIAGARVAWPPEATQ